MRYQIQRSRRHMLADEFSNWYPVEGINHTFKKKSEAISAFEYWYRMFSKGMRMSRALL